MTKILAVDDIPQNVRLLEAVLTSNGFEVVTAATGEEALHQVLKEKPDLVLLDIMLPGIDGYEVCRRLRADPKTSFLPVVMVTASGLPEKVRAIEAGADDFVPKPFDQLELLARVRSLLRVKTYHDEVERQRAELSEWNRTLEVRVQEQVDELGRLGRLRRFLSPQIADVVMSQGADEFLAGHRREITVVFGDLRGFTRFSETAEPEEALGVLRAYHAAMGEVIFHHEGTVEHFAGDGLMVFFNDPVPIAAPELQATRMALAMRTRFAELQGGWKKRGYDLGIGIGIAVGYATLGRIGFEGRFDYGAVGMVVIQASRLSDAAKPGEILVSSRVHAAIEDAVESSSAGELQLKGFHQPVPAYAVAALRAAPA
ncbi:MAG TPA: response regulator [Candidatus Limnocylindria bacterium]|nr:response regulator [Candidatus Limnocylindria bacterium]